MTDIEERLQKLEAQNAKLEVGVHLLMSHLLNMQELILELTDTYAKGADDSPIRTEIVSRSVLYHEIARAIKDNPDLKFLEQRSIGFAQYNQKVDEVQQKWR